MVDNPASFLKIIVWTILSLAVTIAYTGPTLSLLGFKQAEEKTGVTLHVDRLVRKENAASAGRAIVEWKQQGKSNAALPQSPLPLRSSVIVYTRLRFNPPSIELNAGDTLRFENRSDNAMRVALEPLEKTDAESVVQSSSVGSDGIFDIVMNDTGKFRYYNFNRRQDGGVIVVR